MQVKALQWRKPTDHPQDDPDADLMAVGLGGRYALEQKPDGTAILWWAHDCFTFQKFPSSDAAKAAAQTDFDGRLRACLITH